MRRLLLSLCSVTAVMLASCGEEERKWEKFTYREGAFSIYMPQPIQQAHKKDITVFGYQVIHFFSWKPSSVAMDKFRLFEVSYVDCPRGICSNPDNIEMLLDSSIYLRAKDFTEDDMPIEPIKLNGYPARAFIYNSSNAVVIVKQCIVNNRRYDLTVIAKKNYATNKEVGDFFNSFEVSR